MCTFEHPFCDDRNKIKADLTKIKNMNILVDLNKIPSDYDYRTKEIIRILLDKNHQTRPYIYEIIDQIHETYDYIMKKYEFPEEKLATWNTDEEYQNIIDDLNIRF